MGRRVLIQMFNSMRVEAAGSSDDAMYLISFLEQELSQIRSVLKAKISLSISLWEIRPVRW